MGEGWINGGFFVLEPEVLDYIEGDGIDFSKEPLDEPRPGRTVGGVQTRVVLAVHGHAAGHGLSPGAVGRRHAALDDLGVTVGTVRRQIVDMLWTP